MTSAKPMSRTAGRAVVDHLSADLRHRVGPWLQTREGVASAGTGLLVFWILWAAVGAPPLSSLLGAGCAVILVSLLARLWEARTTPPAGGFWQLPDAAEGVLELQLDPNAGFWRDGRGFLWSERIWFSASGCPPCQLRPDTYLRLRRWHDQGELPVFVTRVRDRQWWWWQDAFYWESGDCGPGDVAALLLMLARGDEQGIEWELDTRLAEPIPEQVRRFVHERDGGRCLACGSGELIQYDHVIPWSLGGRNEPGNLRLLCAACKRRQAQAGPAESQPAASR